MTPHRDESFLRTDPEEESKLVGVWMPLDSATLENGCLWYVPGSHKRRTRRHFVRAVDEATGRVVTKFEGPAQDDDVPVDESEWVPVPVEPGASRNLFFIRSSLIALWLRGAWTTNVKTEEKLAS